MRIQCQKGDHRLGLVSTEVIYVRSMGQNMCVCVCLFPTFRLGGHCQGGRAFTQAVSVGCYHPESVFGIRNEVLDGHLHFSWSRGVLNTFPAEPGRGTAYAAQR